MRLPRFDLRTRCGCHSCEHPCIEKEPEDEVEEEEPKENAEARIERTRQKLAEAIQYGDDEDIIKAQKEHDLALRSDTRRYEGERDVDISEQIRVDIKAETIRAEMNKPKDLGGFKDLLDEPRAKKLLVEDHIRRNKRNTVIICTFMALLFLAVVFAIGYILFAGNIFISLAFGLPIAIGYIAITYSISVSTVLSAAKARPANPQVREEKLLI